MYDCVIRTDELATSTENSLGFRKSAARSSLGYDAAESNGKRKSPSGIMRSSDDELPPEKRRKLISNARDLQQNFSLAAWAIRMHLNYVSDFSLQIRSGNNDLTKLLETKWKRWSNRNHCDIARRHGLKRFIRLAETRRVIDGDMGILRLATGQLQAIEGDRIRTPYGGLPAGLNVPLNRLRHGVYVDEYGAALGYSVCRRNGGSDYRPGNGGFIFDRMVSADNMWLHAYHDRFDQIRGVSPLSSALNEFRDTAETIGLSLMKMKVGQLFGLVTTRAGSEGIGETEEEDDEGRTGYKVDFSGGPFHLDLDPGDDARFLENKTPSVELQQMLQSTEALALKSLDIPFSFFDESYTNYSGARQALLQYIQSAKDKQDENRCLLDWIAGWRIWLWWVEGELGDISFEDFQQIQCVWVPAGIPWIDPLKEIQANIQAIDYGLTSPQRVCREAGLDWHEIQEERKEAADFQEELGVTSKFTAIPVTINEGVGTNA